MIEKKDYEALAAFRNALRRFLHFSEAAARGEGLTPQQHQLLLSIKGQLDKEWASVGDIAEALQISHHAAVGLVNRCVAVGWVARESDPTDRRQVRVVLMEAGEEKLKVLSERHLAELHQLQHALRLPFLTGEQS